MKYRTLGRTFEDISEMLIGRFFGTISADTPSALQCLKKAGWEQQFVL